MKILFIGPFSPPISGPAVKNSMMYEWLHINSEKTNYIFKQFDTHIFRRKEIFLILKFLFLFFTTKRIILSVSENGRFLFIPFCYIFRKRILLFPAGGSFDEEITSLGKIKKRLFLTSCNAVYKTYVQTKSLKKGLEGLGFKNVVYFPNPRIKRGFTVTVNDSQENFDIVYLSKIRKGKGVVLLIDAVKKLNERLLEKTLTLNFYGLIDESFKDEFMSLIMNEPLINYKGVAEAYEVQETISKYDIFVLPSMFPEGIPGAVVEAMFTGIPIIVSNFTAANELIANEKDGLIIPQNNLEALEKSIEELILNGQRRKMFSEAILKKAENFDFDIMMFSFFEDLIKSAF